MCSGIEPTEALSGAPYVQAALSKTLGGFGPVFITVAMILFAFTTLLGNLYYVDNALCYMLKHVPGKKFMRIYHIIASLVIFFGAGLSADLLWNIADITMGGMTIINVPVILLLGKYVVRALRNYDDQRKLGKTPEFHAKDIGISEELDYWQ
jgi:AGCS family alanine or glycine:cation symporter